MKTRIALAAGVCAALSSAAQAEVKINESLSIDGYAIGSAVVTEGTPAKNDTLVNSPFYYDAIFVGTTGKYNDLTARVSLFNVNSSKNGTSADAGLLDAYVTYKTGDIAITGGQYLGYLGFESFHSVNNAFISFSQATYRSPFATGAKIDYTGDGFTTGFSVRDSQINNTGGFFNGDGEFSNDLGYEAFASFTGIQDVTIFLGAGYEDVDGGEQQLTTDVWVSYKLSDTLSLAGEYATVEDVTDSSWLTQATYTIDPKLSVSGRLTGSNGLDGADDVFGYGLASTYAATANFVLKGEVTKIDAGAFSYALQGQFKF
ncbi:MAG: outer membrane beta-barrel protein [Verrucomicrobia bacterium]|nr:outer membrane beta-barrel protein [Verrucomicrobiota bacterium]